MATTNKTAALWRLVDNRVYCVDKKSKYVHFVCRLDNGDMRLESETLEKYEKEMNVQAMLFANRLDIEQITLPRCTDIAESAFENCKNLTVVQCQMDLRKLREDKEPFVMDDPNPCEPDTLKTLTIHPRAFKNCENLQTVIFWLDRFEDGDAGDKKIYQKTGTKIVIEKNAFVNCPNLATILVFADEVKIEDQSFVDAEKLTFLYRENTKVNEFADRIGAKSIEI